MFQLSPKEKAEVVAICDHLKKLKFTASQPYAFTEHRAIMLASVLNSPVAIQVSVQIVRAFAKLREAVVSQRALVRRLDRLEENYDGQFKLVFDALRELMTPPEPKKRGIGFLVNEQGAQYGKLPRR